MVFGEGEVGVGGAAAGEEGRGTVGGVGGGRGVGEVVDFVVVGDPGGVFVGLGLVPVAGLAVGVGAVGGGEFGFGDAAGGLVGEVDSGNIVSRTWTPRRRLQLVRLRFRLV